MKARDIYANALASLGYTDGPEFKQKAIVIINKVYLELFQKVKHGKTFDPIKTLNDEIDLPLNVIIGVMNSGIAELLALGEGDGELQQYYAFDYDRGKKKLSSIDTVIDALP